MTKDRDLRGISAVSTPARALSISSFSLSPAMPSSDSLHDVRRTALVFVDQESLPQVRGALLRHGVDCIVPPSPDEALAVAGTHRTHLLIVDTDDARRAQALELAALVKSAWGTSVVFLVHQLTAAILQDLAAVDADGIVCTPIVGRQLEATLRLALVRPEAPNARARERERALCAALDRIAAIAAEVGFGARMQVPAALERRLARLRPRERQVVQLLLAHHRVPAIARALAISPQTVRNHLKSAFKRTGTGSQQALLDWLRDGDTAAA